MTFNARWFYTQFWHFAPTLIRHYLRRRAVKSPAYLQHWEERFGGEMASPIHAPIWVHAVSVGETRAAAPLIAKLKQHFPDTPLLMTQMTPTGRAAAEALFPEAQCRYLPYDKPEYVRQFLAEHQPRFGVLMETEIWPNLMHGCAEVGVPLFLANARLSEKSLRGYLKVHRLIAPALQTLCGCYAQSPADAERLHFIGASNVHVCGNTKYDIPPSETMRDLAATFKQRIGTRPVVIAASTRAYKGVDEAELLLKAWPKQPPKNALLVIVPRHPERFDNAFSAAQACGFKTQKRSDNTAIATDTQVWIGDSMGELFAYYLAADIAFVGGSLVDAGCQNIIEPMSCSLPTLFGPSIYNFEDTCRKAEQQHAAKQVFSAQEWANTICTWLVQPEPAVSMAENAHKMVVQYQGAGQRMADLIVKAEALAKK